jgi:hypothetical protein
MFKKIITTVFSIILIATPVTVSATGTVAADFLNVSVSAYQASLGGSAGALSTDITSSYFNPAGLSFVKQPGISLMHNLWYQDISYEYLGAAIPFNDKSTIGISASYLHMGDIMVYNANNQNEGNISPFSLATIISFSQNINSRLSLGISGKYIMEKLDDIEAKGVAFDIGAQYYTNLFTFGLVVNNIGPKIKYEIESFSLPSSVSIGSAYHAGRIPLAISVGAKIPFNGKTALSTGIDYQLTDFLSLRSGFQGIGSDNVSNDANFGVGFKLMGGSIDYAFNPKGEFGNTHFFSFTFNFGNIRDIGFARRNNTPGSNDKFIAQSKQENDKQVYLVNAGIFSDANSANRKSRTLNQFGMDSKVEILQDGRFVVVLLKTDNFDKAKKIRDQARANGFECVINSLL